MSSSRSIQARRVNLANPPVFIAAFIGAMLIFLFSSLAIRAVGTAAQKMIAGGAPPVQGEPEDHGGDRAAGLRALAWTSAPRPRCARWSLPGILVVGTPILVGMALGPEAAAGLLMVGTIVGILMALFMNNGGGAWDNAKKYIEAGFLKDDDGNTLGKRSLAHEASVVGDTVGDPFKDTAGPVAARGHQAAEHDHAGAGAALHRAAPLGDRSYDGKRLVGEQWRSLAGRSPYGSALNIDPS